MVETLELGMEGILRLIDQRKLPLEEAYVECRTHHEVIEAIRSMVVRGAPAIGIAGAYGMVLAAFQLTGMWGEDAPAAELMKGLEKAAAELERARPTAANLAWAVRRMLRHAAEQLSTATSAATLARSLEEEARRLHQEDVIVNQRMGALGASLVEAGDRILTHCNAGALATGGYGTALGVVRRAWELTRDLHVYVDETRPLFQGARLTAWELAQEGIPSTIVTDSSAGWLMQQGKVDIIFVGADRIAANGDVANKIGTYSVAVLARENGVPFYVVAPGSTIDLSLSDGSQIPIEERAAEEVTDPAGQRVAPSGVGVLNYAFDITPHHYVTGIVTEAGIAYPPFDLSFCRLLGGMDTTD